jgi:hypothetical protein
MKLFFEQNLRNLSIASELGVSDITSIHTLLAVLVKATANRADTHDITIATGETDIAANSTAMAVLQVMVNDDCIFPINDCWVEVVQVTWAMPKLFGDQFGCVHTAKPRGEICRK